MRDIQKKSSKEALYLKIINYSNHDCIFFDERILKIEKSSRENP